MELIEKFKSGDRKSFEILFELYFKRLCAFGYQYLNDVTSAEDLVQDSFVSLWEKRSNFNHENAVKAFLYTTVRNKCLNHVKHQLVAQKHESSIIHELENEEDFNRKVIEEEVYGQLYSEIDKLPEASQKIMLLVLKGLKNREIADVLQLSENTIKTQKKIAYAKLKTKIAPELYTYLLHL